ncbi:TatD family hydrolase [Bacteroides propionicifaciens]|jgi:TatD DNase family protein|uniref:TatD family hydrolase n=1 Tax=Bacteroides propionicifaciens TaxID=392838 RepID=UPI00035D2332|nr:TatD family hydrolase [Bacteroides propionicifaciens]
MNGILDIHAHLPSNPQRMDTLYSLSFPSETPTQDIHQSLGVHPWQIKEKINWQLFEQELNNPMILAIGECGLDKLRQETNLEDQLSCFIKQIDLSEQYKKPLIIHLVKATDELIKLHKIKKPTQEWIVHGFRGKPEVYYMLKNQGISLSIGPNHNVQTVKQIPLDQLIIETDTSEIKIEQVCQNIAQIKNISTQELIYQIYKNTNRILFR